MRFSRCLFRSLAALFVLSIASFVFGAPFQAPQTAREKLNFDLNWKCRTVSRLSRLPVTMLTVA
jgi:hypothetical protein